jgi:hypothetical protein
MNVRGQGVALVLAAQGAVYIGTGLWPVVHLASFESVTGPKSEPFLVHTVGLLLFTIGVPLLRSLRDASRRSSELLWLAGGTAASLGAIDVVYWLNGRLENIYLLDAAMEFVFVANAVLGWLAIRRSVSSTA